MLARIVVKVIRELRKTLFKLRRPIVGMVIRVHHLLAVMAIRVRHLMVVTVIRVRHLVVIAIRVRHSTVVIRVVCGRLRGVTGINLSLPTVVTARQHLPIVVAVTKLDLPIVGLLRKIRTVVLPKNPWFSPVKTVKRHVVLGLCFFVLEIR